MKLSIFLFSLLATSQVTLATPTPIVDVAELPSDIGLEIRSPNPAHEPLAILEQRDTRVCEILNRTIRSTGTSKFTVVYIVMDSRLARQVCEYAGGSRCEEISYIISDGLLLAYVAAAHYSGAIPEGLPSKRHDDDSQDYFQLWETMLSSSDDISYNSLTPLSNSSDTLPLVRRQNEPLPIHRLQITGFAHENSPKHDIIANHYRNGDTVLHLPLPVGKSGANSTEGLDLKKRFDNPGFKISFTTRGRSKLTQAHQKSMALAGAATWAVYADNANHKMDDFIGFTETENSANFYYRIIPELRGFGTNYETVDVCGGMASYL
ncbi:uncharacterized protein BO87DRAFT_445857 [Aspergillus neoniger CBS 115656]|uniref:Uncharacterized protein n=1 Tax=Aspergillus neoniger (strain CBS 115656) TaxID=1448310 RepID=A0A318YUC7_ASPNB|nr:hypothetical protein BO87DRAFT_445857 [Aspergillus neoniger CBS 115656]PYH38086.1 hypothetical protein BO87DRAFT_445857 [Aspergillus neoniger CBS 115656]